MSLRLLKGTGLSQSDTCRLPALDETNQRLVDYPLARRFLKGDLSWGFSRFEKIRDPSDLFLEALKPFQIPPELCYFPNAIL